MMNGAIRHLNPEKMHNNPAFTQAIAVSGAVQTVYIGGQNAVAADGSVVGGNDLAAQTEQVLANMATVLEEAGGTLHDVIKWTIYVASGHDVLPSVGVFQRVWGREQPPPAISVVMVAGFVNPQYLVEIEAIAVIKEQG
jgi:enamine deaminase RidA (YjgF/YER057c/UK114 family)